MGLYNLDIKTDSIQKISANLGSWHSLLGSGGMKKDKALPDQFHRDPTLFTGDSTHHLATASEVQKIATVHHRIEAILELAEKAQRLKLLLEIPVDQRSMDEEHRINTLIRIIAF